jgi:hypothetical protein
MKKTTEKRILDINLLSERDAEQIVGFSSPASSNQLQSDRSDPLVSWTNIHSSETIGFPTSSFLPLGGASTSNGVLLNSPLESTQLSGTSGKTKDAVADQTKVTTRSIVQNKGIQPSYNESLRGHRSTRPSENDVLLGNGPGKYNHPGTVAMRIRVHREQSFYKSPGRTNLEKTMVRDQIYEDFKSRGGRFLEYDEESDSWYQVSDECALESIWSKLRAPYDKALNKDTRK